MPRALARARSPQPAVRDMRDSQGKLRALHRSCVAASTSAACHEANRDRRPHSQTVGTVVILISCEMIHTSFRWSCSASAHLARVGFLQQGLDQTRSVVGYVRSCLEIRRGWRSLLFVCALCLEQIVVVVAGVHAQFALQQAGDIACGCAIVLGTEDNHEFQEPTAVLECTKACDIFLQSALCTVHSGALSSAKTLRCCPDSMYVPCPY